ncbi:hypothetical protein [Alkalihalobacterium alkalinitrilicum]|uniref:hypothetical protein n=1 Tax=Alkalihalobacterium alkalinitrilicum TaxID=427920 RepID=UPI0011154634|nr:hypothetical protein [Alkalihalobacterium alkalinitrilicum]
MLSRLSMIVIAYFVYRFRYRILNVLLGQQWIRKSAVRLTMKIPGLRQKFMSQIMFSPRTETTNNA